MEASVISNIRLNEKFGYMELECPPIARDGKAGRFFMLSVHAGDLSRDPILKRPFAVCDVLSESRFTFLYMIVGRGTSILSDRRPGEKLSITGPLGNYFRLEKNARVALAAGGVGIAPMLLTGKKLKENGCRVTLFYGGKSSSDIILTEALKPACDEFVPVTDDGTLGIKGLVTEPIERRAGEFKKIYACGPNRMLMALAGVCARADVPLEVSLDEHMACGVGACLGCLIKVKDGDKTVTKRCCVEGPVFDGLKIIWDSLCG